MPPKKSPEKPVTVGLLVSQLAKFYNEILDPRFQKIDEKLEEHDKRFDEIDNRFDDLYKKFETLHQEYIVIVAQLKRLEGNLVTQEDLQNALADLKTKITALQEQVEELERRLNPH